jgi:CRP/FNR family cyclic AMP-dependent transcriptional regulator
MRTTTLQGNANAPPTNRNIRFLTATPLLANLSREALDAISNMATVIDLKRNKILWQAGDMADAIYILRTGVVREYVSGPDDRETTIGIYARRTSLGIAGALGNKKWFTTAVSHEDSTLYCIPTARIKSLSERFPRLGMAITHQIFEQMQRAQLLTPNMVNSSAQARLAGALLQLADTFGVTDSRGVIINIKLTHRIIATMTGTTRETVSFAILDLRKRGFIKNDGKRFIILNIEGLKALIFS